MGTYLIGLRLAGRRVLVVGGGRVAQRRVPALVDAGARVTVVAPELATALRPLADTGAVDWAARAYRGGGDVDGAWLVHACTDVPEVNADVAADAEAAGVWCVRADDAEASTAWTPARGAIGDLQIGVLAGGDPRRGAGLRDAIVDGLASGDIDARRGRRRPRGVALVGGGPGDPALLTVRGRRLLSQADVVVVDRLAPRGVLDELADDVEVVDAAKIPYGRAAAQRFINDTLISSARAGRFVVRLKGGDPFLFGRGGEELLACLRAGVPVTVVPGVTSAIAGPAAAGVPVTHRGVARELHVISAHRSPSAPDSTVDWAAVAKLGGTLVLLMAVERIAEVAAALRRAGRDPDTPVAVIADATLPTQRTIFATLRTAATRVAETGIRPPAVVVVGEVVNVALETEMLRTRAHDAEPGTGHLR